VSFSDNMLDLPFGWDGMGLGVGMLVEGAVAATGVPGALTGTGTIVVNHNGRNGIELYPPSVLPAPPNNLDGVVVTGSVGGGSSFSWGAGLWIRGGVDVRLRNSILTGNNIGVYLTPGTARARDGSPAFDDISHVDLGTTAPLAGGGIDYGRNRLQAAAPPEQNKYAGICMGLDPGAGTLAAAGNVFAGPRDCAAASPGAVPLQRGACTGGVDIGIRFDWSRVDGGVDAVDGAADDASPGGYVGNTVSVASCSTL
jgi:hypothetical protein